MSDQVGNQNVGFLMTWLISCFSLPSVVVQPGLCWKPQRQVFSLHGSYKSNFGLKHQIGCLHGDFRSLRDRPRVHPSVYMVITGSAQVFESI